MAINDLLNEVFGTAAVGTGAHDSLFEIIGIATSSGTIHDTLYEVNGTATADATFTVSLGPDISAIEPYQPQAITAVVANGVGATYAIQQFNGPTVLLTGAGPTWTYTTPGNMAGAQLAFRVTATVGATAVSADVQHFISPNTFGWGNTAAQMVSGRATFGELPPPLTVTGATATAVFTPAITIGAADNFTNLQAAIDAANAAGGGIVPIPAGTYLVSRRVILKTGVTLQGAAKDQTILKATTGFNTQVGPFGGKPLITTNGWSNCTIRDLTLDQSGDTLDGNQTGRLNEYLLDIRFSDNVIADRVRTKNPFTYSIVSANSTNVLIRHCDTSVVSSGVYNQLDGIHILNSHHVAVMYCDVDQGAVTASDGDDGLVCRTLTNGSCHDIWYLNNRVRCGSNGHLMQFATDSATSTIYNIVVDSNEFYGSPRPVMAGFYSATNAVIDNIAISNNDFHDNVNAVSMIGGTAMTNIQITNNRAHATGTLAVVAGTGNAVTGTINY